MATIYPSKSSVYTERRAERILFDVFAKELPNNHGASHSKVGWRRTEKAMQRSRGNARIKTVAEAALRSIQTTVAKQTWKALAKKATANQFSKEGGILAVKNLAKQLGINLTKRKTLQAIPIVGSLVGASVNGWYIKDLGWAARRSFQERWLSENGKLVEIE